MDKGISIFDDSDLLAQMTKDPTYRRERTVVEKASRVPKRLGKIIYVFYYLQALIWSREKRLAMKMSTVYLTAKDYLVECGVPKELLDIMDEMFGVLGGKPVAEPLRRSVQFICVSWHARMARVFNLLLSEFKDGKNIASYGCGSGIIELLALIASGNKDAKLTLIDIKPANIALAQKLAVLFRENGYDVDDQVTMILGDINNYRLPKNTNVAVSIGLLHNYYSLSDASKIMEKWFADGAEKVISDICYDPEDVDNSDAKTRIDFISNVLDWPIYPEPDGLLFYNMEDLYNSISNGKKTDIYDHGQNATVVIHRLAA